MKRRTLIEYADASPAVRAIYDDVLTTIGAPVEGLPNWIKAIGNNEHVLKAAWEKYKNVVFAGDVPLLLKHLILVVISMRAGNRYCSASHGHIALSLDRSLSCDDLYSLAQGKAFPTLPPAFQVAISTLTQAVVDPAGVEDEGFDFENELRKAGFSELEIDELLSQADFGVMMNQLTSLWQIKPEVELPPPSKALATMDA